MSRETLNPPNVGIFCASSFDVDQAIKDAAKILGQAIAGSGWGLVYGGTSCGLMKIVSEAHKEAGGKLIGVIPDFMISAGIKCPILDETIIVKRIADRKVTMNRLSGAFVVLPGGIGTFDEFFDTLALKQLKLHEKPIILLNTIGYFEPLLEMIRSAIKHKTISPENAALFQVAADPLEVIRILAGS